MSIAQKFKNQVSTWAALVGMDSNNDPAPIEVTNGAAHVLSGSGSIIDLGTFTTNTTGSAINVPTGPKSIEALLTGTGAISVTVSIYGAHTERVANGTLIGTLTPSGTTTAVDSLVSDVPWPYIYAVTSSISGTSASVNVTVGV